jgi:hypothetical protein
MTAKKLLALALARCQQPRITTSARLSYLFFLVYLNKQGSGQETNMTELTGQQIETLRRGLQKGYPHPARFEMFLREQLDKRLTDYAANVPLPQAIFNVIEGAEAEGWVKPLVAAAYRTRRNHPAIEQIAVELGVALLGS